MAEESFFNYINNNPLYVHNKLEPFLSASKQIENNINYNFLFKEVIDELKREENKIYNYLSYGGTLEDGKRNLSLLGQEIYSNNENRKNIFNYMQQLFGKIDSTGNPVSIQSTKSSLPVSVNFQKNKGWLIKKGKNNKPSSPAEAQQIVSLFCNNWNFFIQQYDDILKKIQDCILEGTIDLKTGERFKSFRTFLEDAKRELGTASLNNYNNYTQLSDSFTSVIRAKVGQWGDIIGFFNEVCKYDFDDNIDKRIKDNLTFKRADDIDPNLKSAGKFAKADNVIIIDGTLENPGIVIPVSLKFTSQDFFKIQTSPLSSVAAKISVEPDSGGQYANYFKYLLINNAYWGKELDKKINKIVIKILQKYIYLFFSGSFNDDLLSKAIFMSSTIVGDDGYSSHFFSIASLLEALREEIIKGEEILNWDALKVGGFSIDIKKAQEYLTQASASKQLLRTTVESRESNNYSYGIIAKDNNVREVDKNIFDQLSSLVGSKGITIKNSYINKNLNSLKII